MTEDPTWPLQVALVDALETAVAPVPVLDTVPQGTEYPYLTVGEGVMVPDDDKTCPGFAVTFTLQAWQRAEVSGDERGSFTPKRLLGQCYEALHRGGLQLDGFNVWAIRFEGSNYFADADPHITRGVARLRVQLHPL